MALTLVTSARAPAAAPRGEVATGRRAPGRLGVASHPTRPSRRITAVAAAAGPPTTPPEPMPRWESIYGALTAKHGLTASTPPSEAARLVAAGSHVLLDVRPPGAAAKASPTGAVNVPLYLPFNPAAGGGVGGFMKAALLALNGVAPTAQNPAFVEDALAAAGGRAVLVLCETGGSLVPTTAFAAGKPSRSLQAAFRLLEDGRVKGVAHVEGGAYAWAGTGLPFEGEYDGEDAGRTPGVVQGQKARRK